MGTRFNSEYANLWKEVPLFLRFALRRGRPARLTGQVLIVNTCLVGEFAASLPAIRAFIMAHPDVAVDLMVAPPLKDLAARVKGVRKVYTAASVYEREPETADEALPAAYDGIIALRMSKSARDRLLHTRARWTETGARHFIRYGIHLLRSMRRRESPKQWRTLNFEMLGIPPTELPYDEILNFSEEERTRIRNLEAFQVPGKAVIIHTWTKWPMKRWDADRWAELLTRLNEQGNLRFVFVGTEEDRVEHENIASQLGFATHSLIGELSLAELALALAEADYFIGIDSGPMNLAHLVDVPSVSLLGPGPHMYLPTNPRDRVIDKTRGRGLLQMFVARERGFMHEIHPDEVAAAFMHIYDGA